MIPAENQRFMAGRMGAQVRTHSVDHVPMVTAPILVADLLAEVVGNIQQSLTQQ